MKTRILQKLIRIFGAKTHAAVIHETKKEPLIYPFQDEPLLIQPEIANSLSVNQNINLIHQRDCEDHVPPHTKYLVLGDGDHFRKVAYTVSGNLRAQKTLLCLPGLLETKESFTTLHAYFLSFKDLQVISMDFPGRGDSDELSHNEKYSMSLYLSDIGRLIDSILLENQKRNIQLTILGTSMGGVLAMYLTQKYKKLIYQIILNDIALTVNWTALYHLYKSIKNEVAFMDIAELAQELSVAERAISDVQLPGHFDLAYQPDVWGMNFHDALIAYKGKLVLIYGSESKICTNRRVEETIEYYPHLKTFKSAGAGHPVPYDLPVCEFIQEEIGVMA